MGRLGMDRFEKLRKTGIVFSASQNLFHHLKLETGDALVICVLK
jgi:hypothetical protein